MTEIRVAILAGVTTGFVLLPSVVDRAARLGTPALITVCLGLTLILVVAVVVSKGASRTS